MSNFKEVHVGAAIKRIVEKRGLSYAEFARLIHCERATVYHLFKCKSIDVERLLLISEILEYDFIHELYFHGLPSVRFARSFAQNAEEEAKDNNRMKIIDREKDKMYCGGG